MTGRVHGRVDWLTWTLSRLNNTAVLEALSGSRHSLVSGQLPQWVEHRLMGGSQEKAR